MTRKTTKTPAPRKRAAAKPTRKKKEPEIVQEDKMVEPLNIEAFKMAMQLIDNADIKGGQAGSVLLLKQELARVAGAKPVPAE